MNLSGPSPSRSPPQLERRANRLCSASARAAIADLPGGQQQVLLWRVFDEVPHAEIAARLGISVSTARTQYWKARLKLQTAMSGW